jgi:hypothetical protein
MAGEPTYVDAGAIFDTTRRYRYRLWRTWDWKLPRVAFIMLNPSTADERRLDPTLRRCLGFAQRWGCGAFEVGNLYALRSTDPLALWDIDDPVGPANDEYLATIAEDATFGVVLAWGANARQERASTVVGLIRHSGAKHVFHLGELTRDGFPRHPLYLRGDLLLTEGDPDAK